MSYYDDWVDPNGELKTKMPVRKDPSMYRKHQCCFCKRMITVMGMYQHIRAKHPEKMQWWRDQCAAASGLEVEK